MRSRGEAGLSPRLPPAVLRSTDNPPLGRGIFTRIETRIMTLSRIRGSLASHRVRGEQGMALLEVMMASVILVISMIGLALLFSYGASYVAAEGGERVSLFLAQQRLEELRAMGLGRATAETDRPIPGFAGFVRTTTIVGAADLDGSGNNPRIITVSVRSLIREAGPISVSTVYARH
jgi:hypothetical protein